MVWSGGESEAEETLAELSAPVEDASVSLLIGESWPVCVKLTEDEAERLESAAIHSDGWWWMGWRSSESMLWLSDHDRSPSSIVVE